MNRIVILLLIILLSNLAGNAQDSLLRTQIKKLQSSKQDTNRVINYCQISKLYLTISGDTALLYAQRAMNLSVKLHFEKGIALSYLSRGGALLRKEKYSETLNCYLKALAIGQKLNLPDLNNKIFNNIGTVYLSMKNYPQALSYFFSVLNSVKAQKTIDRSFELKVLVNIAETFKYDNQLDSAIFYNMNSLAIAKRTNNQLSEAIILFNIAENYMLKKDLDKALLYLNQSLPISVKLGDKEGITLCLNDYSEIFYQKKNYKKSIQYAMNSLDKGKMINIYEYESVSYKLLYLNYKQLGDFKKALDYRNLEISLDDSLSILKKEKQIQNILSDYELKKKNKVRLTC